MTLLILSAVMTAHTFVTAPSGPELASETALRCELVDLQAAPCNEEGVAPEVREWADRLGLDPLEYQGAVASTGLSPEAYAIAEGFVSVPAPRERLYRDYPERASRMDCIISKESQWLDVMNHQGSGAGGPGQYMQRTWDNHVLEMKRGGLIEPDREMSRHNFDDVFRVMDYDLGMGRRAQWAVGGC